MNKIYVFPVIPHPMGDCVYRAVAEDGEDLASQVSSSEAWGKRDLGVEGEVSPYYKDKYTAKYPGGYQIEYVPDWKRHPALVKLLPTENTPNADSVNTAGSKDDVGGCSGCGSWIPNPNHAYSLRIQLGIGESGLFTGRMFCTDCFVKIETNMNSEKVDGLKKEIDRMVDVLMGRQSS